MYDKAYEIIRDMADKRLLAGEYVQSVEGTTCYCAIGALLDGSGGPQPDSNDRSIGAVMEDTLEVRDALTGLGLTWSEVCALQELNDTCYTTASERYGLVLAWLKEQACSS